jgi:hypothetical protein
MTSQHYYAPMRRDAPREARSKLLRWRCRSANGNLRIPLASYHRCADMSTPYPAKRKIVHAGARPPKIVRNLETWHENQDSRTGNDNRDGASGPADPGIGGDDAYHSAAAVTCSHQSLLMAETETLRASIVFRSLFASRIGRKYRIADSRAT